jgi:hypothetical protein
MAARLDVATRSRMGRVKRLSLLSGVLRKPLSVAVVVAIFALVGAMQATAGSDRVPFTARFSGAAQFTSTSTVEFEGSGQATHMGLITNFGDIVITGPPDEFGCLPNTNTEFLTAANGDLLVLEMDDVSCPIDETGLRFKGSGDWHVIDGTGRFAGVTGSGSVAGFGNFADGIFGTTVTGYIEGNNAD